MSIDLHIVTFQQPIHQDIVDFAASQDSIVIEGAMKELASNVLVSWQGKRTLKPYFTIDGPFKIEIDDIDETVAGYVLSPNWLVHLSVPALSPQRAIDFAIKCAKHIAQRREGAVYDPQGAAVIWPRGKPKRFVASPSRERIRLIELEWFLPISSSPVKVSRTFLKILRKMCPEALPTRYGDYEPLPYRLDVNNPQAFVDYYRDKSESELGDFFFWYAQPPCYGGFAHFSDRRQTRWRPEGCKLKTSLKIHFDGRALQHDKRWLQTVVNLFVAMARGLNAFYAVGYVLRNVIAGRRISHDSKTEEYPLPGGGYWHGIPSCPTWLTWFGEAYKHEVESCLKPMTTQKFAEGILLQAGEEPMDLDQLKEWSLEIPARLLHPAEFIPPLD